MAISDEVRSEALSLTNRLLRPASATTQHAKRHGYLYAIRIALLVALGHFVGARLGFAFGFPTTQMSILWPPTVVLIVALLLTPRRLWWVVMVAALPLAILDFPFTGAPLHVTALYYVSNVGQALLTAILLQRFFGGVPRFDHFLSTAWFIAIAAIFAPAAMSFLLAVALVLVGWISDGWVLWQARFLSDALTALTLGPPVLTLLTADLSRLRRISRRRYLEAGLLALSFIALGIPTLGGQLPQLRSLPALIYYLPLPLFLWAGVRFGVNGVSASMLIASITSLWSASYGQGPFAGQSPAENVLRLQLFLIRIGLPFMLIAALLSERRSTIKALRKSNLHIRNLADKLLTAQEEERRSVARELHDEIGQALTTVKISLDTMRLIGDAETLPSLLDEGVARVDLALEQVRNLSLMMRPSMLDDLGLEPALRWLSCDILGSEVAATPVTRN